MIINKIWFFIDKYSRWEFWPSYIADIPVYVFYLFLSFRAKSFLFFSNINPCMKFSGFAGYGKYEDTKRFPPHLLPKTILCTPQQQVAEIKKEMLKSNIIYPCIAKPDLGRTGRDIKKLHDDKDLKGYLEYIQEDFLIQEFLEYPLEFGIFYYRLPSEEKGHITGIVEKSFLLLEGDGTHDIGTLIFKHPRAKYYHKNLYEKYQTRWEEILPKGEILQLNYIGNHCRGSAFYDREDLITPQLQQVIDNISKEVKEFYFGRYDVKVESIEDLNQGKMKVIELNGAGSLPTHIYDPNYGMLKAYKTLFHHWSIIYAISRENKERGYPFLSWKEARAIIKKYGI